MKIMKKEKERIKIFVGMSGGVDSSTSAALLKEQGYDVSGVFIKVWYPSWLECDWRQERRDAMRVCAQLNIPFLTFDFEKEYKKEVIDYMIREYNLGRTPNPDVSCNKNIKFGSFLKKALEMGVDFVATGHYSKLRAEPHLGVQHPTTLGCWTPKLLAGKDKNKDQSYFLWILTQDQLKHIIFPVGDLEKLEVRKLAKKFNLPVAEKKDSQGLCFIGKINFHDFLKKYIKSKKGKVVDEAGNVVGAHDGVLFFTTGQRHGFEITERSADRKPYFVVGKDIGKNLLIVSHKKEEKKSFQKEIIIQGVNWVSGEMPDSSKKYTARIRYRQTLQSCSLKTESGEWKVIFDKPQRAVAPGQSLVLYDGETCLGGGVIT